LLHALWVDNATVSLNWNSLAGTTYRVLSTTNLANATWTALVPDILANGPNSALTVTNSNTGTFYRVIVVQ
jgi:hypothetical protein